MVPIPNHAVVNAQANKFFSQQQFVMSSSHDRSALASSRGKKSKSGRRVALASSQGNTSERELSLPVDPRWCPIQPLPFGDSYGGIVNFPSMFSHAMVNDSKNWAHPETKRWDLHSIANAIRTVVMPRFSDLAHWRQHVCEHLGRLCTHRRGYEDATEKAIDAMKERQSRLEEYTTKIIDQMKERITQTNEYTHQLRDKMRELNKEVKLLEKARVDLVEKIERLPRRHRGARSSSPAKHGRGPGNGCDTGPDPERGRSPGTGINSDDDDDDHVPARARPVPEMILEAQLDAISQRSRSPGPDSIAVWREYSNSPGPQRFV